MFKQILSQLGNNIIDIMYAAKHIRESKLALSGLVTLDHYRDNKLIHTEVGKNTFTTEGMNNLLDIIFGTSSKAGSNLFYVGIFKNNITPSLASTAAVCLGAAGTFGECLDADYSVPLSNKPGYVPAAAVGGSCTNAAASASFTIAQAMTVYGAFLSTAAAKTANTGLLYAAKKFGTPRAVIAADVLAVTYVVSCTTS
jgi:hypothetical protein